MAILTRGDVVQGQLAVVLIGVLLSFVLVYCCVQLCLFCGLLAVPFLAGCICERVGERFS